MTDMKNTQLESEADAIDFTQLNAVEENYPSNITDIEIVEKGNGEEIEQVCVLTNVVNNNNNIIATETTATASPTTVEFVVRKPRTDSKLILQNMEEVLKSVKKKHRAKHKRKRELKKLARLGAAAAAEGETYKEQINTTTTNMKKRYNKKPLQVAALENESATSKHNSILQHFPRTPKKSIEELPNGNISIISVLSDETVEDSVENSQTLLADDEVDEVIDLNKAEDLAVLEYVEKKANAFEVMMNARNKSIGTNCSGNELPITEEEVTAHATPTQMKRKLILQNWAERKGAGKRRLEEENRTAYVEQQMEQRAKRLKNMLVNSSTPKNEMGNANNDSTKKTSRRTHADTSTTTTTSTKRSNTKKPRTRSSSATERNLVIEEIHVNEDKQQIVEHVDDNKEHHESDDNEMDEIKITKRKRNRKPQNFIDYFQNGNESESISPTTTTTTIKTRSNKKGNGEHTEIKNLANITDVKASANGRPKRTCAEKRTFVEHQPNQQSKGNIKKSKTQQNVVVETIVDIGEDEIVDLESSAYESNTHKELLTPTMLPENTPKNLAPLFRRSISKPLADATVIQARREFLRSGVPEKVRLEQQRQKQYEDNCANIFQLFPTISHVLQIDNDDAGIMKTNKCLKLSSDDFIITTRKAKQKLGILSSCTSAAFKQITTTTCTNTKIMQCLCNLPLLSLPGKRLVAKAWKLQHDRFPTFKCYNQLREKYRFFNAIDVVHDTQQVSESLMVTRLTKFNNNNNSGSNNIKNNNNNITNSNKYNNDNSNDALIEPPATAPNGELLFTDKYKPLLYEQVLINLTPVMQLREFLNNWSVQSWQYGNSNSSIFDGDSDPDFDNISKSRTTPTQFGNTVVLLGPHSSGKTNAVFALANELNFNVLEINAGMKRTGKRLLQELHEATQSHQIRKKSLNKTKKQPTQPTVSNLKNKRRKSRINSASALEESDLTTVVQQRKCLILIEDADIAFEQTDAGFFDAIYTLATVSKRPVIIVASNPHCPHLQRLMQQFTISFALPTALSISRYMSVLSLIENCPVCIDDLLSLYLYNNMDLRRTLLELQLFVQSGGDLLRGLVEQRHMVSPTKRRLDTGLAIYTDLEQLQEIATEIKRSGDILQNPDTADQALNNMYTHKTLFDFYTIDQNATQRIPYPVDFELLYSNLPELLQKSQILCTNKLLPAVRRSRCSPKKTWLSTSLKASQQPKTSGMQQEHALCNLYEHLSVAALLDADSTRRSLKNYEFDALAPRSLAADLTHTLVERGIQVNANPQMTTYNLFQKTKSKKNTISDYLSVSSLRGARASALDWDPIMRNICRCELQRANEERRSTRFYHYLRSTCIHGVSNFSTNHFDEACSIFKDDTGT